MLKRTTLAICITAFALSSCQITTTSDSSQTLAEESPVVDMHTSQTSLDWDGTYEGVTPCADCPGIKTTIVLNSNNTFSKHLEYLEREDASYSVTGSIEWDANGSIIALVSEGNEKEYLKVREGNLLMLDADAKEITGAIADRFVLAKKN